jgi:hypothetical protein
MHSDVTNGFANIVAIRMLRDITCDLDTGDDLQAGIKEGQAALGLRLRPPR